MEESTVTDPFASMPRTRGRFRDILEIKQANIAAGYHFFDPPTLRFFGSRVSDRVYGGRIFVTSERDSGMTFRGEHVAAWDGRRCYTLRIAHDDGSVDTIGDLGQYASWSGAHAAAERIAARLVDPPK